MDASISTMRLKSVNVGRTQTHDINGQPVQTAYLKQPAAGPVRVTYRGLAGNDVAQHTDAVYAFAEATYDYWADELRVARNVWPLGYFGENLTVTGLDERNLCLGDRVRIGSQVELVVAGPRIPCFKLAWRMNQPESFIHRFATSGRTGVYFAVATEGEIVAGDSVEVVERSGLDAVAIIADLIWSNAETSVEHLQTLLNAPSLSQTVALGLRSRLFRILDGQQTLEHRWSGWREFRVSSIDDESIGVRSYRLRPVDGGFLPRFCAGQFLTVRCAANNSDLQRTWSLSDYESDPTTYRISIKREPEGVASRWLHDEVGVGTTLQVRAPAGRFILDRGAFKPVVLIAAGVGITPLLSMARSHIARGGSAPPLHLIHCVRDGPHAAFKDELRELARLPGVHISHVYSQPRSSDAQGRDYIASGRLTLSVLEDLLSDTHIIHGGRRIDLPWYDCEVYLCGPASFQESLLGQMAERGINTDRVRRESFLRPCATSVSGVSIQSAEIVLKRSGRVLQWTAEDSLTLLGLLERHSIEWPSACRMGVCHSCRCKLHAGEVAYDVMAQGVESGSVLVCCSRPASARLVLDV